MRRLAARGRGGALPWALAVLALVLAFIQRRGVTYTDTRIELTVDPGLFLERVLSVWSSTTDLGHVQSGQFVGYLFPMGPWFAATDALGIPPWVAERLWLALLLWFAGLGVVRLLQALHRPRIGAAHAVAAVVFMANPYVVVQANRATASLLAYVIVPWLLLAAHRGLRSPRGWRWPAAIALLVAAASGGTNAATVFWVAIAPIALVGYEVIVLDGRGRDALAFAWRAVLLTTLASAWWIVPLGVQTLYGPELLAFSEQPRSIWRTTSMAESLRLMGYWISYFASGFGEYKPTSSSVAPYLTRAPVIVGTFAVPLLAFGGLIVARRWRHAPFFGLLTVFGLLVMAAGYPITKPAARAMLDVYYELPAVGFLRTTYKAGPLVAVGLACLAGIAVHHLLALRAQRLRRRPSRLLRLAPLALLPAVVLAAYPMFRGHMIERSFAYGDVPRAWTDAMGDAARATPPDRRIMVLPGQQFGWFRWGQTFSPLAPALTERPVLQRAVSRLAPPRAAQLQDVVDDLVQQRRLVPGQLDALLALMGVGQVVVAADGRPRQSGEVAPAALAEALSAEPAFARPDASYGALRRYAQPRGEPGAPVPLPDLRRYAAPPGAPGIVRLDARERPLVLEGDSDGIAALAASGALRAGRAVFYAGDLGRERLAELVRSGAGLVFSDTNRRRVVNASLVLGDTGPTLRADEEVPREQPDYELFDGLGPEAQTVAEYAGLKDLRAPQPPELVIAEMGRRPYLALDGRLGTTWSPAQGLGELTGCACLELEFDRPVDLSRLRVHPRGFATSATLPLGVSADDGPLRRVDVSPLGWNRVPIRRRVRKLRLAVASIVGPFGIDEIDIPGIEPREVLRLPTRLSELARGLDLSRTPIGVELQRTTADAPYRTDDRLDPEAAIERRVTLPVARRFAVSGWATTSSAAPDAALDRLAGLERGWRFSSSGRLQGLPGRRASAAFDGRDETAWVAPYTRERQAWLAWRSPAPVQVETLRLRRGPAEFAFPEQVEVRAAGRVFRRLPVASDGSVRLPRAIVAREVRIDVLSVEAPGGREVQRLLDAVAVGEVEAPGLPRARRAASGPVASACGALVVRSGAARARARVTGTLEDLDGGRPLRLEGCGGDALELPGGSTPVSVAATAALRPDRVTLRSGPQAPAPAPPGSVLAPGDGQDGRRDGVRLDVRSPAWLVLAESHSEGWRAWCTSADGAEREIGEPRPIDGYANGWPVEPGCRTARMAYAPQRAATASYAVSGLTALALAAVLLVGGWRSRRRARAVDGEPADADVAPPDPVRRPAPVPALATALVLCGVGAFAFSPRMGAALGAGTLLFAFVGVSARRLLALAAAAVALVPVLYVSSPTETFTALSTDRPTTNLPAHWIAVSAVCAVAAACLIDARRRRRST